MKQIMSKKSFLKNQFGVPIGVPKKIGVARTPIKPILLMNLESG
jgi:hypothetical protein